MKTLITQFRMAMVLGLCLFAAASLRAQPFGGFGGFGGYRPSSGSSSGSQSVTYNANGAVGNATISLNPETGDLTIIADEDTTRYISEVISNMDHPQPQVLIKVVFLEVTHNDSMDLGLEGSYNGESSLFHRIGSYLTNYSIFTNTTITSTGGSTTTSTSSSIQPGQLIPQNNSYVVGQNFGLASQPNPAGTYSLLGADFSATLRAIATAGKAQLLSRPSVLARNNQPATIVVGQQVPLITSVRYDTFGNAINSVSYQNVGIILKVTPFITGDGMVQMIVQPQTSSIDPTTSVPISSGVNAPVIDTRSADTVVVTPDGQTIVIGGLMESDKSHSESKIPFLGDIPLIGNLFKHNTDANAKTELMIFLTPHIIQAPTQLAALSEKERSHTLTPKSYSEEELDRFLDRVPPKPESKPSKKGKAYEFEEMPTTQQ